jgi:hypothetical protein
MIADGLALLGLPNVPLAASTDSGGTNWFAIVLLVLLAAGGVYYLYYRLTTRYQEALKQNE